MTTRPLTEADDDTVGDEVVDTQGVTRRTFAFRQLAMACVAFTIVGYGISGTRETLKVRAARASQRPTTIDLGFVNDMLDHHDQAVEMSLIALARPGISGNVRNFATEVIMFQRYEIGLLTSRLNTWGTERGDENRTAMTWMGMRASPSAMPGMATPAQLDQLRNAKGIEADRSFLTLMREHHRGGIHMSDYARANAKDDQVIELAARMAYNQKLEVDEYTRSLSGIDATK